MNYLSRGLLILLATGCFAYPALGQQCSHLFSDFQRSYSNEQLITALGIEEFKSHPEPLIAYEKSIEGYPYEKQILSATRYMLELLPELAQHGSEYFHGSRSASLMGLIDKNKNIRGLRPTGVLLQKQRVPFSGELANGIAREEGINKTALSVTRLVFSSMAISYTKVESDTWSIEKSQQIIDEYKQKTSDRHFGYIFKSAISIETKRQKRWEKLSEQEKSLVLQNFPVLYGLKPNKDKTEPLESRYGDVEYLVMGGVDINEIRTIFVPVENILFVKDLLSQHDLSIPVEALDPILKNAPEFNEFYSQFMN